MQLTRIFGLHGSGKSTKIYEYLEECVKSGKHSFLIVPEQNAVAAERLLIERLGNPANMYVEVINFKRLCNRVFRESGGVVAVLPDDITKQLAMTKALEELTDVLKEYSALSSDVDFALKMLSVVNSMKTASVKPKDIERIIPLLPESLKNKLHDIILAQSAYNAYLENKLEFPGDLLDKLYETLCGFDFFSGKSVFIDSFYGFTAQELSIIGKIIETADNTCISFLCESETQKDISFSRGTDAARDCRRLAENSGVAVKDLFLDKNHKYNSKALSAISYHFSLSALSDKNTYDGDGIEILSCGDIYAESECALRIASELLLNGAKPREIAICAASPEEYEGILDREFEKAGIPLSFDTHADLSSLPVSALVIAAFEIYFTWSRSAVTAYIKTGLSGLDDADADTLELYMSTWNINGRRYFNDTWYMNPQGFVEDEPDKELLDRINVSKDVIMSCIEPFCSSLDRAKNASDIARAVYFLTKDIAGVTGKSKLDDGDNGVQTDMLFKLLDSMNSVLGDEKMTPARFCDMFKSCVKNMKSGKIPELIDQVRFSGVSLMRNDGIKYVIVMGANDGVFPGGKNTSDMFRDSERRTLKEFGINFADTDEDKAYDELFLAYSALCSATDKAYVLYRKNSLSGETMYKSVIVSILEKMFGIKAKPYSAEDILSNAVSDETLFDFYMTMPNGSEKETLKAYFSEKEQYKARLENVSSADSSDEPLSDEVVAKLYGGNMHSSYSRIEKYRECPLKYFLTYTLKLTPEPVARLGAPETGNTVHKVLEELIPEFTRLHFSGEDISDEKVKQMVKDKLAEMLEKFMHGGTDSVSKRFEYMFSRLENSLNSLCLELVKELKVSKFVPSDFELKLSYDGEVSPLMTEMSDGRKLAIVGAIDRVDVYKDEQSGENWVRITDYKTGSKEFKIEDAREGFNLQMLLYLYAITCKENSKYGKAKPAGVIYRIVSPPASDTDKFDAVSSGEITESESVSTVSGIVVQDENVIYAMEPNLDKKGRFTPVKTVKGELRGTLPYDELALLLEDAVKKASELAEGISSGDKRANPYKSSTRDACKYCDYTGICRYKE